MKYCSNCGKQVADEAFVCPNCGCRVDGTRPDGSLSAISIIGFVFAFIMPLVGLIISTVAHSGAKREGDERSARFSKAGIIISVCWFVLALIIIIAGAACYTAMLTSMY